MLDRDVDQRIDIRGVKSHYWLVGDDDEDEDDDGDEGEGVAE